MKFLNEIDGANKLKQDANNRLVTDTEKAGWDSKASGVHKHTKSDITDFPTSMPANGGNASTVNGKTVAENVPAGAKFTDTIVDISGKADKSQVLTNVPANAKFTDTIYSHPATHPYSMITGTPSSLPANGGDADTVDGKHASDFALATQVLTNVPASAKFTDTVYSHPATHSADMITDGTTNKAYTAAEKTKLSGIATNANNYSHPTTAGNKHIPTGGASGQILRYSASGTAIWGADNDTITTVNGKTGAITKADITALGIPAQDTVVNISGKADASVVSQHLAASANKHIAESGTNTNGRYIKFDDGTLICYFNNAKISNNGTTGSKITFPSAFSSAPSVSAQATSIASGSLGAVFVVEMNNLLTVSFNAKAIMVTATSLAAAANNTTIAFIATGRWK